jgi:hypothetical protein
LKIISSVIQLSGTELLGSIDVVLEKNGGKKHGMCPQVGCGFDEIEYFYRWAIWPCGKVVSIQHYPGAVQETSCDACGEIMGNREAIIANLVLLGSFDNNACHAVNF